MLRETRLGNNWKEKNHTICCIYCNSEDNEFLINCLLHISITAVIPFRVPLLNKSHMTTIFLLVELIIEANKASHKSVKTILYYYILSSNFKNLSHINLWPFWYHAKRKVAELWLCMYARTYEYLADLRSYMCSVWISMLRNASCTNVACHGLRIELIRLRFIHARDFRFRNQGWYFIDY